MVNAGRPSRGCAICKKRKIKCDLSEPACRNCLRSGWSCPGCRKEGDVKFRNQTQFVIRKSHFDLTSPPRNKINGSWQVSPPVVDQATAFFFNHYVFGASQQSHIAIRGHHEYLPALYRACSPSGALATITAAAGLASLANAGNSSTWSGKAYVLYGKALHQIQKALSDPLELKSDQTLAAVMLMGTFEAITCADKESMKSLGYHTIAAAKLISIRGPEQFRKSPMAIRLFLQIRRLIVLTSHQMQEPMPFALKIWSQWAEPCQLKDEYPANRFSEINEQLAAARAYIKHQTITDPLIIESLLEPLDKMLQNWRENLPESWSSKPCILLSHYSSDNTELGSHHDVYPDMWIASMWNNYRSARILIHETIFSAIMRSDSKEKMVHLQSSINILREMTAETCRSVEYHMGYCGGFNNDSSHPGFKFNSQKHEIIPGGYLLIWPLYMAGMLPTTTKDQRNWMAEKLCQIGINMGVRLAFSLGTVLYQEDQRSFSHTEMWII